MGVSQEFQTWVLTVLAVCFWENQVSPLSLSSLIWENAGLLSGSWRSQRADFFTQWWSQIIKDSNYWGNRAWVQTPLRLELFHRRILLDGSFTQSQAVSLKFRILVLNMRTYFIFYSLILPCLFACEDNNIFFFLNLLIKQASGSRVSCLPGASDPPWYVTEHICGGLSRRRRSKCRGWFPQPQILGRVVPDHTPGRSVPSPQERCHPPHVDCVSYSWRDFTSSAFHSESEALICFIGSPFMCQ